MVVRPADFTGHWEHLGENSSDTCKLSGVHKSAPGWSGVQESAGDPLSPRARRQPGGECREGSEPGKEQRRGAPCFRRRELNRVSQRRGKEWDPWQCVLQVAEATGGDLRRSGRSAVSSAYKGNLSQRQVQLL